MSDFWSGVTEIVRNLTPVGVTALIVMLYRLDKRVEKVNGRIDVMRVTLVGENGNNGVKGEVKTLRSRSHELANDIQTALSKVAVLEARLEDK